jgi:hypothetical protein
MVKPFQAQDDELELSSIPAHRPDLESGGGESDQSPLLPTYTQSATQADFKPSPHVQLQRRRKSPVRSALGCICLSFLIILPSLGLAWCYFGDRAVTSIKDWDQVPDAWKQWLENVVAVKANSGTGGSFPTK